MRFQFRGILFGLLPLIGSPSAAAGQIEGPAVLERDPMPRIVVGEDRPVEIGAGGFATIQPHLAADPRDAARLVGAVLLADKWGDPRYPDLAPGTSDCAVLASSDSGRTWIRHDFPSLKGDCGDPWVAMLDDGSAVFLAMNQSELLLFRSPDGGRTWSDRPVSFGRGHDHPTLGVDRSAGPLRGSVYAVSSQNVRQADGLRRSRVFVVRSTDGGVSFGAPTTYVWSNWYTQAANPLVLTDGTLVVPFTGFRSSSLKDETIDLAWSIVSANGGSEFSAPRFIGDCAGHFPQAAVDASSGPFRDHLYWACNARSARRIYMFASSDRGESWSDPVVVSGGSGRNGYVGNLAVAVNGDGVVGVSWYDARNDPRGYRHNFRCQELFFSASLDGGQTFLPEVRVSSAENCGDQPANAEAGMRFTLGGEYHGMAASADGRFQLLWSDSRSGIFQLRTAAVEVIT